MFCPFPLLRIHNFKEHTRYIGIYTEVETSVGQYIDILLYACIVIYVYRDICISCLVTDTMLLFC